MELLTGLFRNLPRKPNPCGAELKPGTPNGMRCELPRAHLGYHRNRLTTWMRTPAEVDQFICDVMDRPYTPRRDDL